MNELTREWLSRVPRQEDRERLPGRSRQRPIRFADLSEKCFHACLDAPGRDPKHNLTSAGVDLSDSILADEIERVGSEFPSGSIPASVALVAYSLALTAHIENRGARFRRWHPTRKRFEAIAGPPDSLTVTRQISDRALRHAANNGNVSRTAHGKYSLASIIAYRANRCESAPPIRISVAVEMTASGLHGEPVFELVT